MTQSRKDISWAWILIGIPTTIFTLVTGVLYLLAPYLIVSYDPVFVGAVAAGIWYAVLLVFLILANGGDIWF